MAPGAEPPAPAEPPSGRQVRLTHGDQEVFVTEVGATLRSYVVGGTPVLDGFAASSLRTYARGQMLLPWPGRIGDGCYSFGGEQHQLPLTEVPLANAIHGLTGWVSWVPDPLSERRVVMRHRLHPQDGYPFSLDLALDFELGEAGLSVGLTATNVGPGPAPFGAGAHPYLTLSVPRIDSCTLRVPARSRLLADERMLPAGRAPVDGTELDYRGRRPIGGARLDTAYTDLERDPDGLARVCLEDPGGRRIVLWVGPSYRWLMLFTGDSLPPDQRRHGLAVEPMTCPPDAFRSGEDLIVLHPGESAEAAWGIDVSGTRG